MTNQIQNYLVHAILAGWLSDFPDMNHTDYASMGANDLEAIKEVLLKKDFSFAEAERTADDTEKEGSSAVDAEARGSDAAAKEGNTLGAEARASDATAKEGNALGAEARNGDAVDKDEQRWLKGSERNPDFVSQHFHQDFVDWSGGRPPFELR